jgi:hypothetical protein
VLRYLLGCPRLLVAYDIDAEGEKGAERLRQLSPRIPQAVQPDYNRLLANRIIDERPSKE